MNVVTGVIRTRSPPKDAIECLRKEFLESLKLLDECYVNTHTHVNNYGGVGPDSQPVVYEISFLNKRLWDGARSNGAKDSWVTSDQPNNPQQPEIVLNFS